MRDELAPTGRHMQDHDKYKEPYKWFVEQLEWLNISTKYRYKVLVRKGRHTRR